MITSKYKVSDLLEIIKQNREQHLTIYHEALEGFTQEVVSTLSSVLKEIEEAGKAKDTVSLRIPKPENNVKEYDNIIRMLEMSTEETITLDEHQFSQYVMDEWGWSQNWRMSNSAYSATARSLIKD